MISVMDGRREKEGEGNEGGGGFLTRSMTFDVSFVSRWQAGTRVYMMYELVLY